MTLERYLLEKQRRLDSEIPPRERCWDCRKPVVTCQCARIRPVESSTHFVILIHGVEARRSIATGRLAHLSLPSSTLIQGTDFTDHPLVNSLIDDPNNYPVVLYPGVKAVNLSTLTPQARKEVFPSGRRPVVFVIDGTWSQAKRMKRLSLNLHRIPHLCFTPPRPSGFLVRKQPHEGCFSTIESIHHFLQLVGENTGGAEDSLLEVFQAMVQQQLSYEAKATSATARRGTRKRMAVPIS